MAARLEEIKNGASVRGIASAQAVHVVSVDWIGDQAISVAVSHRFPGVHVMSIVPGADRIGRCPVRAGRICSVSLFKHFSFAIL